MWTRVFGYTLVVVGLLLAANFVVSGPRAFGAGWCAVLGGGLCSVGLALYGYILIRRTARSRNRRPDEEE